MEEKNNVMEEIYVPSDYSGVADIPADLKKMAESIQRKFDNFQGKSDFSGDYNDLSNKPDLSTFVTESDLNDKLGEIDTLLTNIVVESEAI